MFQDCDTTHKPVEEGETSSQAKLIEKKTEIHVFQDKTKNSDLTFRIEDKEVHVSRAVLSVASPVFSAMLDSEFQEKSLDIIDLPEKKFEEFVEFLECIYPNMLKPVTVDNVFKVTPLADEYQVDVLKDRCHDILLQHIDENTCGEDVIRHLQLAEKYEMLKLKEICISLASELTTKEMNSWMEIYPVSVKSRDRIKDKALMRFELEKDDNAFVKEHLQGEVYNLIKSKVNTLGNSSFSFGTSPSSFGSQTSSKQRSNRKQNTGTGGICFAFQTVSSNDISPTDTRNMNSLRGLRLVYKYCTDDLDDLKDAYVGDIRQKMVTFSENEQEVYELLPEAIKHEIRGKNVWTIPQRNSQ